MCTWLARGARGARGNPQLSVGLAIMLALVLIGLVGPLLISTAGARVGSAMPDQPPSWKYPLGTDTVGRQMLPTMIVGIPLTLRIGLIAAPRSSWTRSSVSITCRCTTTSRALLGSSATITFGRRLIAIAMQTRCFMPPLSSWGNRSATSRFSPTCSSRPATRASNSRADIFSPWSLRASTIWSLTRMTGLSEFIAPCATSAMTASRSWRIRSSGSANRLRPSTSTRPPSTRPGGLIRRSRVRAIVDLPEPDSPTRPKRSCAFRAKLTPSTAFIGPRGVW